MNYGYTLMELFRARLDMLAASAKRVITHADNLSPVAKDAKLLVVDVRIGPNLHECIMEQGPSTQWLFDAYGEEVACHQD
jgi:hypothetical protein